MQIPVLLEPVAGNGYRARGGEPFALTAEGATSEEALRKLRVLIEGRLAQGARLVQLEIKPAEPPWARFAGTWAPDDPVIDEWLQAVEEYRHQKDADPDFP